VTHCRENARNILEVDSVNVEVASVNANVEQQHNSRLPADRSRADYHGQHVDYLGRPMPDDFQIAAERARTRIGEPLWQTMSFHAQTIEIYLELRALDTERAAQRGPQAPTTSGTA
jgi:hypothetical protein